MAVIRVEAERTIAAPPQQVYDCIADFATQHARWLPPNFSDYAVEQGGRGAGTVISFRLKAGNRERAYRMSVSEPQPGSVLVERDTSSSLATTWTLTPRDGSTHVALRTEWEGHGGVGGFFERLFAPIALRRIYNDELARLDGYITGSATR